MATRLIHSGRAVLCVLHPLDAAQGRTGKIDRFTQEWSRHPAELTVDFRRIYQLNLPDAIHQLNPTTLTYLWDGLGVYPDSLYRAWKLEHDSTADDVVTKSDGEKFSLQWFGFSQDSTLLLDVRNTLHSWFMSHTVKPGQKPTLNLIQPPGSGEEKTEERSKPKEVSATYESMALMFGGAQG